MSKKYLETFFAEKQLPEVSWEIPGKDGTIHFIDSEVVKEAIFNCGPQELKSVADKIRQIDFVNGDVNDFLKHLAKGLVERYEG